MTISLYRCTSYTMLSLFESSLHIDSWMCSQAALWCLTYLLASQLTVYPPNATLLREGRLEGSRGRLLGADTSGIGH